jgi:hypothetical protein
VGDIDGTIAQVRFFRESNGTPGLQAGDQDLGFGVPGSPGLYSLTVDGGVTAGFSVGSNTFYARPKDNQGAVTGLTRTAGVDGRPIVASLSASPSPAARTQSVTLTASGVSDPDSTIQQVTFFRESNGNPGLQTGAGGDTNLGMDTNASNGYSLVVAGTAFPVGSSTLYARARDTDGAKSLDATTTLSVTATSPLATATSVGDSGGSHSLLQVPLASYGAYTLQPVEVASDPATPADDSGDSLDGGAPSLALDVAAYPYRLEVV